MRIGKITAATFRSQECHAFETTAPSERPSHPSAQRYWRSAANAKVAIDRTTTMKRAPRSRESSAESLSFLSLLSAQRYTCGDRVDGSAATRLEMVMASTRAYAADETCELAVIRLFAFSRSTVWPPRMTCAQ